MGIKVFQKENFVQMIQQEIIYGEGAGVLNFKLNVIPTSELESKNYIYVYDMSNLVSS